MSLRAFPTFDLPLDGTTRLYVVCRVKSPDSGHWVNNTVVSHLDLSLADPAAMADFQYGRAEAWDSASPNPGGGGASFFRPATIHDPKWVYSGLWQTNPDVAPFSPLGTYYVPGTKPLTLDFTDDPVETDAGPGWPTKESGFAFQVKRADATTATTCRVNLWLREY